MDHNDPIGDHKEEQTNASHSDVGQPDMDCTGNRWNHIPDHDPEKILINEKTVYAVDQAMNVVLTDLDGNILYGNQNIFDLTLYTPEELLGKSTKIFNAGYHSKEFFQEMWETIQAGKIWRGDIKNRRKDGKIIWVRLIITPLLDQNGKPFQFLALKEDITEKKEMEFRLAQKDKQLSALTKNSYDIVGIIDKDGSISYLNPAFERVLGFSTFDTIGKNFVDYLHSKDASLGKNILQHLAEHPNQSIRHQLKFKHKDRSIRWCDVAFNNYLDDPYIHGIVFNLRDFTQQKEASDIVDHLANYDYLTGLPNRRHFESQLRDSLKSAKMKQTQMAVVFLDLDGFKNINDTLGHEIGDGLLKEVGHRLSSIVDCNTFVGRLGGDEFSIIIQSIPNKNYLLGVADALVQSFCIPFTVGEYELNISSSIGISIFPDAGEDIKTLLKHADIAMYHAKHSGKNHYQIYQPSMDRDSYKLFLLKNDLTKALEKEQFFMVYQPKIGPDGKEVVGAEAYIRWSHPELGFITHLEFIHFAEESGFIIPLGEWILKTVSRQMKAWQDQGYPALKVSVNISVMQLMCRHFLKDVKKILAETGLEAKWLEFEINEAVLCHKEKQVKKSLDGIKKLGISLALDHFGTGYSALNFVVKHQFNVIKIDHHMIDEIVNNGECSHNVALEMVKLIQKLHIEVIAVGVETAHQFAFLANKGFDAYQGFYFSKPMEKEQFAKKFLSSAPCLRIANQYGEITNTDV